MLIRKSLYILWIIAYVVQPTGHVYRAYQGIHQEHVLLHEPGCYRQC